MWQPTEIGNVVAEREVVFERGETRKSVTLLVGQPVRAPGASEDDFWWCPIMVRGLSERVYSIGGVDSLQAILLALGFARSLLPELAESGGGRVYWEEGDLDCLSPSRGMIDAYATYSAEVLQVVRELTDALDGGDIEKVTRLRRRIEALESPHRHET